ncbi:MAG: hypothetical protein ACI4CT_01385 [Lachnospiraceae bacterium]
MKKVVVLFYEKMSLAPAAAADCGAYLFFLAPFSGLRKTLHSMSITLDYAPYEPTHPPKCFKYLFYAVFGNHLQRK